MRLFWAFLFFLSSSVGAALPVAAQPDAPSVGDDTKKAPGTLLLLAPYRKRDAIVEALTKKAELVFHAHMVYVTSQGPRDGHQRRLARRFLMEGVQAIEEGQPLPVVNYGTGENMLVFSDEGYFNLFFRELYRLKPQEPAVLAVRPDAIGDPPEVGRPFDLEKLDKIVESDLLSSAGAPGDQAVVQFWKRVRPLYVKMRDNAVAIDVLSPEQRTNEELQQWGAAFGVTGRSAIPEGTLSLDTAGLRLAKVHDPFKLRVDQAGLQPNQGVFGNLTNQSPRDPFRLLTGQPAGFGQGTLLASDFRPQIHIRQKIKYIPQAHSPRVLSISEGTRMLIERFGTPQRALGHVIIARGGDAGQSFDLQSRIDSRDKLQAIVGGLRVPVADQSVKDARLKEFDHALNAWAGVSSGILAPESDDWWITRKFKTLGRTVKATGVSIITLSYNGVKLIDQTTGSSLGSLVGQDFHDKRASPASFDGNAHAAAWRAAFQEDYTVGDYD